MTNQSPSPFSTTIPNFQIAWDSTSLGWLKKCPRLYQYQMVEGWTPHSKGIHLAFGGYYASAVERHAHYIASGLTHDEAILKMTRWVLEATGEWVGIVTDDNGGEHTYASRAAWDQWVDDCNSRGFDAGREPEWTWAPWESNDPFKNRYTLLRSLIWGMDEWKDSPWEVVLLANGKPAVELSFNFPVFDLDGESISLSGHMDKMVTNSGTKYVMDDKTTKGQLDARYFAQYSPHNQMSLYTIAGKVVYQENVSGVLIRGAQIQVGFTRFATQPTSRPQAVLDEWLGDFRHYVTLARSFAINNYWPQNDTACNDYGGCPFRKVCSVSPSHRKSWLASDFTRRQWNPLQARGDDI